MFPNLYSKTVFKEEFAVLFGEITLYTVQYSILVVYYLGFFVDDSALFEVSQTIRKCIERNSLSRRAEAVLDTQNRNRITNAQDKVWSSTPTAYMIR